MTTNLKDDAIELDERDGHEQITCKVHYGTVLYCSGRNKGPSSSDRLNGAVSFSHFAML
jgi:hypothetical protein